MGIDMSYPQAYAKAALAAGQKLPTGGKVFVTVMDKHKDAVVPIAQELQVGPGGTDRDCTADRNPGAQSSCSCCCGRDMLPLACTAMVQLSCGWGILSVGPGCPLKVAERSGWVAALGLPLFDLLWRFVSAGALRQLIQDIILIPNESTASSSGSAVPWCKRRCRTGLGSRMRWQVRRQLAAGHWGSHSGASTAHLPSHPLCWAQATMPGRGVPSLATACRALSTGPFRSLRVAWVSGSQGKLLLFVLMQELGFSILATRGTAAHLTAAGIKDVEVVLKIQEGRPNAADLMKNKDIQMMMITSTGNEPDVRDGKNLRRLSLALKVWTPPPPPGGRHARRGGCMSGFACMGLLLSWTGPSESLLRLATSACSAFWGFPSAAWC